MQLSGCWNDALTSGLLRVVFSKGFISRIVGVQVQQWIFWDISDFQDQKISDDFMEGDLGEVDFGEGLHCIHLRLPYK